MRGKILFFCLFLLFSALHADASEQIMLGIIPFTSKASELPASSAARVSDIMIRNLNASQAISVIERERLSAVANKQGIDLSSEAENHDSVLRLGKLVGCRYIMLGSVTGLSQKYEKRYEKRSALLSLNLTEININEAEATIEARLIDTETGKVVLSISRSGSAVQEERDKKAVISLTNKISNNSASVLKEQAIEAAASRVCDKIREVIADEYPMVISVNINSIRINRGINSGVSIGSLYRVYQEGEELFDLNGSSLGKRTINLAVVRLTDVQSDFSTAVIWDKQTSEKNEAQKKKQKKAAKAKKSNVDEANGIAGLICEGDKLEAISLSEAENLKLSYQRKL